MNATPLKFALVALAVASTAIACTAADVPEPGEETADTSDALKKPKFGGGAGTSGGMLDPGDDLPPIPPTCRAPAIKCGPEENPGCCVPGPGGTYPTGIVCYSYIRPCPRRDPYGVWRCYATNAYGTCS